MEPGLIAGATFTARQQNFPNGCHVCELEIDEETGKVEILRYSVVDDVGTVINPLLLEGQICGGVAQGVGQVLMEDIRFDASLGPAAHRLVHGLRDAARRRPSRRSISRATRCRPRPTRSGVKGAGEAGNVGALPAVANALVDALSPLGIRHIEMPATPERMWRAIHAARG